MKRNSALMLSAALITFVQSVSIFASSLPIVQDFKQFGQSWYFESSGYSKSTYKIGDQHFSCVGNLPYDVVGYELSKDAVVLKVVYNQGDYTYLCGSQKITKIRRGLNFQPFVCDGYFYTVDTAEPSSPTIKMHNPKGLTKEEGFVPGAKLSEMHIKQIDGETCLVIPSEVVVGIRYKQDSRRFKCDGSPIIRRTEKQVSIPSSVFQLAAVTTQRKSKSEKIASGLPQ